MIDKYTAELTRIAALNTQLPVLLVRVAQRPDAIEALGFVLAQPEGGPSCGCGANHWSCDFGGEDEGADGGDTTLADEWTQYGEPLPGTPPE